MKRFACVTACVMAMAVPAQAEIAVVALDGKQVRDGDPTGIVPDAVGILDIGAHAIKTLALVSAPATIVGPPSSVAVARDSSFAIVTASQKIDPADASKRIADDAVSVIDLTDPAHPRLTQSLHAGPGASGISISPAGTLALVASTEDNTLSIFTVSGRALTPAGHFQLEAGSRPTDVAFTPDGKTVVVTEQKANRLVALSVNGTTLAPTGIAVMPGSGPFGLFVTRDGYVVNSDLAGPAGPADPAVKGGVTVSDPRTGMVTSVFATGSPPEQVALSPDGRYVALNLQNGGVVMKSDPRFASTHGLLWVLKLDGGKITPVTSIPMGHWVQGAAWSAEGKSILVEADVERALEVYHFDGKTLTADPAMTITFEARPTAIATAHSR